MLKINEITYLFKEKVFTVTSIQKINSMKPYVLSSIFLTNEKHKLLPVKDQAH